MFGARFHGVAGLAAESPHRERHRIALNQAVVEPGRPLRADLLTEIEIRADRQHQGGTRIAGLTKASYFDNSADRRCMFEGLDPSEADVVRASVCSVDQGISLASQFVMQSPIDQPPNDLGRRLSTFDDVVGNATRFSTLSEGAVHGLDDVAAHAEVAETTLGLEPKKLDFGEIAHETLRA